MKSGSEIRQMIISSGIRIWKVAERYGLNDGNFSRKLRGEFSDEETERIICIIKELKKAAG